MRFPIFRTCIAICTDGSCNSIYKNTDSFLDVCPYELATFLDNVDEESTEATFDDEVGPEEVHDMSSTMELQDVSLVWSCVAQHYNQLEDRFIQKYFIKADIQNVTFKE